MSRGHADVLRASLTALHAYWGMYRKHYGLRTIPARPPPKRTMERRATAQARADVARGYRVLPAVTGVTVPPGYEQRHREA